MTTSCNSSVVISAGTPSVSDVSSPTVARAVSSITTAALTGTPASAASEFWTAILALRRTCGGTAASTYSRTKEGTSTIYQCPKIGTSNNDRCIGKGCALVPGRTEASHFIHTRRRHSEAGRNFLNAENLDCLPLLIGSLCGCGCFCHVDLDLEIVLFGTAWSILFLQ